MTFIPGDEAIENEKVTTLEEILEQLKLLNMYMEIITDVKLTVEDLEDE